MWDNIKNKFDSTDSFVSLALGLAVVLVIGMTVVNYVKSKNQAGSSTTQENTENKAGGSLPTNHTVAEGETLWSISEKYYNSGYNWVDIQNANKDQNPDVIEVGKTLIIPVATPIMPKGEVSSAAVSAQPKDKSYTVVAGDDLWDIALKEYGTGYKWTEIAVANKLENPNIIHPGNVLVMP